MTDLVLLANVNHTPCLLEQQEMLEIPIKVEMVHFICPSDKTESATALRKRTRGATEILFPSGRRSLAIERGDRVLIEGIYDENHSYEGYKIQRVNVLSPCRKEQGLSLINATYRNLDVEGEFAPYVPAAEEIYRELGVKPPQ